MVEVVQQQEQAYMKESGFNSREDGCYKAAAIMNLSWEHGVPYMVTCNKHPRNSRCRANSNNSSNINSDCNRLCSTPVQVLEFMQFSI